MNKEETKHFKAMLRQGSLRHMNILLDDKFQKELLNIIKDYEKLQQENKELHNKIDKAIEYIENADWYLPLWECRDNQPDKNILLEILKKQN